MSEYDNRNTGAIFGNDRKETDRHPDSKGSINVICPHCQKDSDFWVSAWRKVSKGGKNFLSISVKAKEAEAPQAEPTPQPRVNPPDDDIPF